MTEEKDDWWDAIPSNFRILLIGALLSGAGSGAVNLGKDTSDRFKGADFAREIAIRDARIRELERSQQAHFQHSARYTEIIEQLRQRFNDHMMTEHD